ncbi:MAG: hypothetical protein JXR77_17720 [Lentisphaeria bacterium]|nr:hypothetical protein [Lentisphaeria bacterium]
MTDRQRFRDVMGGRTPDRLPMLDEGIREEVLVAWRTQGLPRDTDLRPRFGLTRHTEIAPSFDLRPALSRWPTTRADLDSLECSLDPRDPARLPDGGFEGLRSRRHSDDVLLLRVYRGFFLSLGVDGWSRFAEVALQVADDPAFVRRVMAVHGRFAARLAERILREVEVEAAIFSEPIGDPHRPLLSPKAFREVVLPAYGPILEVLTRHGVANRVLRTYTDVSAFLPDLLARGINVLWIAETDSPAVDYLALRRTYGNDLGLIGGIPMRALYEGPEAIRREIDRLVPPLLAGGRYLPLAAGRVREDLPFRHYVAYRHMLEKAAGSVYRYRCRSHRNC